MVKTGKLLTNRKEKGRKDGIAKLTVGILDAKLNSKLQRNSFPCKLMIQKTILLMWYPTFEAIQIIIRFSLY